MKEDFHIDMSNRFYSNKTTGIAFVGSVSKTNKGCALSGRLKRSIENIFFNDAVIKEYAKLYAISIYYIIKNNTYDIKNLIICNDEDFEIVKGYLIKLLKSDQINLEFNIINITEYRISLGRKVKSLEDNYARIYARKGLKIRRWKIGKEINVVPINLIMIKDKWNQ